MKCLKGVFFLVTAFVLVITNSFAGPARLNPFCIHQSDGLCLTIQQYGDEHYHYTVTLDGYLVIEDSLGDYVYADSFAVATSIKAKNVNRRSDSDKAFLKSLNQRKILEKHRLKNENKNPLQKRILNEFHHKIEENRKALYRPKPESYGVGECHFPVFLVSTSDRDFSDTAWYRRSLNEPGFSEDEHYGSVKDYFLASSNGLFEPIFDVFPVKISRSAKFSAQPEADKEGAFLKEVLDSAVPNMGDLSRFDKNGDKVIDGFAIIVAGMEQGTGLWGHMYWYMVFTHPQKYGIFNDSRNWNNNYNGFSFDKYLIITENADATDYSREGHNGIGIFIHEFSHILGLPDFYAQGSGGNFIEGPSPYDIMTRGMYNGVSSRTFLTARQPPKYSAFERESMGWMNIKELEITDDVYLLEMIDENKAYGVTNPRNNDEYYIVEYRPRIGWDAGILKPETMGVLIWYINYDAKAWNDSPNQNIDNPRYKIEYVIDVSSQQKMKSYENFKFSDVGVYNVIEEKNKKVCFATNPSITVKCPLYSSSSIAKSSSSMENNEIIESSSSALITKIVSEKNVQIMNTNIASTIIVNASEIVVQSKDLGMKTFRIVDILGNEIKKIDFSSFELNIPFTDFPHRGIYAVQVFEGEKRVAMQKILVK